MRQKRYSVAGHSFTITMAHDEPTWVHMSPFEPFECMHDDSPVLFNVSVVVGRPPMESSAQTIGHFDSDMVNIEAYRLSSGGCRMEFGLPHSTDKTVLTIHHGSDAMLSLDSDPKWRFMGLDNALMLLYTLFASPHDTLLLHASVAMNGGRGYMFQGRSGTGKSTHSQLWCTHIEGTELLNDDNPVVRFEGGVAMIYGTPWSGKTSCYRNLGVPLGGIVRIIQAPSNCITRLPMLKSYASLLPSCSCIRWDKSQQECVHRSVERLITTVPCYNLECLPDMAAAELCHATITKQ